MNARWEATTPNNLPAPISAFIGRAREKAALQGMLLANRLVTLTGPGGAGKTRLALEVAAELLPAFPDGVFFVSLATARDPALVLARIAQALGLQENDAQPLRDRLRLYLRDRKVLLLLDNFEQVAAAAPDVAALLRACPQLTILVTSRSVLHVLGETEFPLSPLQLPDLKQLPPLEELARYEAIDLFVQRARALNPSFALDEDNAPVIAEICVRLDGLPLAIELAAARTRALSPRALLARLSHRFELLTGGARDLPEHQRTLRDTIAWSYDLLAPPERTLFRRLSVFAGGFDLEAAERLGHIGEPVDVVNGIVALIDESLLLRVDPPQGEPRYAMLETIREFGLEQLDQTDEAEAIRTAHAQYYLELAERAEPQLKTEAQLVWLARLETEQENFRAALQWSLASPERIETALRLVVALGAFWALRTYLSEGRRWLERVLAQAATQPRTDPAFRRLHAWAAFRAATLAEFQGDLAAGHAWLQMALEEARALGDASLVGYCLVHLAPAAMGRGDLAAARAMLEEALGHHRSVDDRWGMAGALGLLGLALAIDGDIEAGRARAEEGARLARTTGDRWRIATSLFHLYMLMLDRAHERERRALLEECLAYFAEVGDRWGMGKQLFGLAVLARLDGDRKRAAAFRRRAVTMFAELGREPAYQTVGYGPPAVPLLQRYADARLRLAWRQEGLALARAAGAGAAVLDFLEAVAVSAAGVATDAATARLAVQWLGAAESARQQQTAKRNPAWEPTYNAGLAMLRQRLGEAEFAAAFAAGQAMPLTEALDAADAWTPPPLGRSTIAARPSETYPAGLSAREVEVLRLVAAGLTNAQIAEQLTLSPLTVNAHLRAIYNKLGVSSRSAATRFAIEHHLV